MAARPALEEQTTYTWIEFRWKKATLGRTSQQASDEIRRRTGDWPRRGHQPQGRATRNDTRNLHGPPDFFSCTVAVVIFFAFCVGFVHLKNITTVTRNFFQTSWSRPGARFCRGAKFRGGTEVHRSRLCAGPGLAPYCKFEKLRSRKFSPLWRVFGTR